MQEWKRMHTPLPIQPWMKSAILLLMTITLRGSV